MRSRLQMMKRKSEKLIDFPRLICLPSLLRAEQMNLFFTLCRINSFNLSFDVFLN